MPAQQSGMVCNSIIKSFLEKLAPSVLNGFTIALFRMNYPMFVL